MNNITILVTGAQNLGHIAVIRSLGRAGYKVIACSEEANALGFYSNYTTHAIQHPSYLESDTFIAWLNETIKTYDIKIIIPTESFMIAIQDYFNAYQHLLPYDISKELIYNLFSKYYLFNYFINEQASSEIKQHLPTCYFLNANMNETQIHNAICNARFPIYLKADATCSNNNITSPQSKVMKLQSINEALSIIPLVLNGYHSILLQEHVEGIGVGVFFLIWKGKVIQYFMHQRIHEVPYTGGVSSYRRSFWHEAIYKDALNKVRSLHYNGVIMFEYRWSEETNLFYLLEVNSRFWGSLHLALFSGVDFPAKLVACMQSINTNNDKEEPPKYPINVLCRHTIPLDLQHTYSKIKDDSLSFKTRAKAIVTFFYLMLNYKVHSDLLFKKDRRLYWLNFKRFIKSVFKKIA